MSSSRLSLLAWLAPVAAYVFIFACLSTLFSFFSWDHAAIGTIGIVEALERPVVDIVGHSVLGAQALGASRRWNLILAGGLTEVLVDMDHAGRLIGLPRLSRGSHSLIFSPSLPWSWPLSPVVAG